MNATLQRMTTATLLPPAYLAEMTARTASIWAWQTAAMMRSADALRDAAAETPAEVVDLAEMEARDAAEAEIDLVRSTVEKMTAGAAETTDNLLDAVDAATAEAADAAETVAARVPGPATPPKPAPFAAA